MKISRTGICLLMLLLWLKKKERMWVTEKKKIKKRAAEVDAADETTDVPAKQRAVRARTNLQQQLDNSQRTAQELARHSIRSNA